MAARGVAGGIQRPVRDRGGGGGLGVLADSAELGRKTLCIQEDRTVGNDNTVKWAGMRLQLPPSRLRPHFVRTTMRLYRYPDGTLAVFWGPQRLGDYDTSGCLLGAERLAA